MPQQIDILRRKASNKGYYLMIDSKFHKWRVRFIPLENNKDIATVEDESIVKAFEQAFNFINKKI